MIFLAVDVDGTIIKGNSSVRFGRYLFQKGLISPFKALLFSFFYMLHIIGFLSLTRLHAAVFSLFFHGKKRAVIEEQACAFIEKEGALMVRESVLREIQDFRKRGATVSFLSSSPSFLVAPLAKYLSADEWHATEYLVDEDGSYSFIKKVMTGEEKARIAFIKKKEGMKVVAISDSMLDEPLFLASDEVVAVSPERKLVLLARRKGWRILKDEA